jgi:hypothetical protein
VGRTLTALGVAVAMQTAAICAPLVHAHLDDHPTDHHDARGVHAHLGGHAHAPLGDNHDPAFQENAGEDAIFLNLFVAVAGLSIDVPVGITPCVSLQVPDETPARLPVLVVHGHDPPFIASVPARAPPSFLS